jgi:hypothetical protein
MRRIEHKLIAIISAINVEPAGRVTYVTEGVFSRFASQARRQRSFLFGWRLAALTRTTLTRCLGQLQSGECVTLPTYRESFRP